MPIDYRALDERAVRASVELVSRATDLSVPTPCAGWTLHDLLVHMTVQHEGFAASSRGERDLAVWKPRSLGADPIETYRVAADQVIAAFAASTVAEFVLPEFNPDRPIPAWQAMSFHFIDYVVHSWDVARALGAEVTFEPDLLRIALDVARAVPEGESRLAPGASFAPAVPWQGGSRLDEIVAILGRSPTWKAPARAAR